MTRTPSPFEVQFQVVQIEDRTVRGSGYESQPLQLSALRIAREVLKPLGCLAGEAHRQVVRSSRLRTHPAADKLSL